jgi:predicted ester cyclase
MGGMEPWELRAWYAEYLEACNRHDLAAIREFLHPSVRRAHLPSGADAWIDDFDARFRAFPDWRWRRIHLVIEDDRIAAHLRGSGTHAGAFRDVAPTRRHANIAEFAFYRVEHGRFVEYSGSSDDAELLAQLRG